uniref:Uncharacterized protein n=1 Tax=Rhizophora mucronata TaxID=61149 RepID=A0A2P2M8A7_RHIMU
MIAKSKKRLPLVCL